MVSDSLMSHKNGKRFFDSKDILDCVRFFDVAQKMVSATTPTKRLKGIRAANRSFPPLYVYVTLWGGFVTTVCKADVIWQLGLGSRCHLVAQKI